MAADCMRPSGPPHTHCSSPFQSSWLLPSPCAAGPSNQACSLSQPQPCWHWGPERGVRRHLPPHAASRRLSRQHCKGQHPPAAHSTGQLPVAVGHVCTLCMLMHALCVCVCVQSRLRDCSMHPRGRTLLGFCVCVCARVCVHALVSNLALFILFARLCIHLVFPVLGLSLSSFC